MIKQFYNFIKFTIRVALIIALGLAAFAAMGLVIWLIGMEVTRIAIIALLIVAVVMALWMGAQEYYKGKPDADK